MVERTFNVAERGLALCLGHIDLERPTGSLSVAAPKRRKQRHITSSL